MTDVQDEYDSENAQDLLTKTIKLIIRQITDVSAEEIENENLKIKVYSLSSLCRLANIKIDQDKKQIIKLKAEIDDYKILLSFCDNFVGAVRKREVKLQQCLGELEVCYEKEDRHQVKSRKCFPFLSQQHDSSSVAQELSLIQKISNLLVNQEEETPEHESMEGDDDDDDG